MNQSRLPLLVRATAAALAVFMTIAILDGQLSIAEPQQSQLLAQTTATRAAQAAALWKETLVAQAASANAGR